MSALSMSERSKKMLELLASQCPQDVPEVWDAGEWKLESHALTHIHRDSGKIIETLAFDGVGSVHLSRSERPGPVGWFRRLFRRPAPLQPVLHAELRSARKRLSLLAPVSKKTSEAMMPLLPELPVEGYEMSLEILSVLVMRVSALDIHIDAGLIESGETSPEDLIQPDLTGQNPPIPEVDDVSPAEVLTPAITMRDLLELLQLSPSPGRWRTFCEHFEEIDPSVLAASEGAALRKRLMLWPETITSGRPLTHAPMNALLKVLLGSSRQKKWALRDHGLEAKHMGALAAFLAHASRIQSIDLSQNPLGNSGVTALMRAAPERLEHLHVLRLGGCRVGPQGAASLAQTRALRHLESLHLWSNPLGDEGVERFAQSTQFENLKALNINHTNITDAGFATLLDSPLMSELEVLYVSGNSLTDRTIDALIKTRRKLHRLTSLNMQGCKGFTTQAKSRLRSELGSRLNLHV